MVAALTRVTALLTELGRLVWEASTVLDEQSGSREELLRAPEDGARHRFSNWPNQAVMVAAGAYTIWYHEPANTAAYACFTSGAVYGSGFRVSPR